MNQAVVTVALQGTDLRRTFSSFLGGPFQLYAFIMGGRLPDERDRLTGVRYVPVLPTGEFGPALRELYFRRLEILDDIVEPFALVVDSYDVLCLRYPDAFGDLLGGRAVAGCVEHQGSRYVQGSLGATQNFLNAGVLFWDVDQSHSIRSQIADRGRRRFRTIADDQLCLNEVLHQHPESFRILPCQYNFRAYLRRKQRGWPTVEHLDGVHLYHNHACIEEAKLIPYRSVARLDPLPEEKHPPTGLRRVLRRAVNRLQPQIVK